jgi:hypothetical protein
MKVPVIDKHNSLLYTADSLGKAFILLANMIVE